MAIPVYLWLYDEDNKLVKGSVDVTGREGSIELTGIQHDLFMPCDDFTGAPGGTRQHETYTFEKEIDSSSPLVIPGINKRKNAEKSRT